MRGRAPRSRGLFRSQGLRDAAFVCCLTLVLGIGVVGVLMLNTLMQQQSDRLDQQRQRIAQLSTTVQALQTQLDQQSDPARLAVLARRLHMRPASRPQFMTTGSVTAPAREAGSARAG